jgi:hypothetical protein
MSKELERAREFAALGDDGKAIRLLWAVYNKRARTDRSEAEGLLEVASQIEARASGGDQAGAAALAAHARTVLGLRPEGHAPADSRQDTTRRFLFGDQARPTSLALGLVAAIACFPLIWVVALFLFGMSGQGDPQPLHFTRQVNGVLVGIAAGLASLGFLIVTAAWVVSRRRVPAAERKPLSGLEGAAGAAVVIAALAAAAVLGHLFWNYLATLYDS